MVGDALSRFWHSRYYKVSRISKMLLSTVNSGPPESLHQRHAVTCLPHSGFVVELFALFHSTKDIYPLEHYSSDRLLVIAASDDPDTDVTTIANLLLID